MCCGCRNSHKAVHWWWPADKSNQQQEQRRENPLLTAMEGAYLSSEGALLFADVADLSSLLTTTWPAVWHQQL